MFSYNSDGTLDYKIDQKGQKIKYIYDSYKRVTQIQRFSGMFPYNEVTCERTTFYYDTNPLLTGFTQNGYGRLVATQWGGVGCTGGQWTEMYSYKVSGRVLKKRLSRGDGQSGVYLEGSWTWDDEGRMQSVTYPLNGPTYTYEFDAMGRSWKLKDNATPAVEWAKEAEYDAGNRMTGLDVRFGTQYYHEARGYNELGQLTSIEVPGLLHQTYAFLPGQNNGRIWQMNDLTNSQLVQYTYDSLNRLKTAQTVNSSLWGQSFSYDGFGNMTSQEVTQGQAPDIDLAYDPQTKRINDPLNYTYDPNGNLIKMPLLPTLTYDIDNRLTLATNSSGQTDEYRYDPAGKRIWKKKPLGQTWEEETYFYGVNGEKLGTYVGTTSFGVRHTNLYFAGKLVHAEGRLAVLDRLGSNHADGAGPYFPYGEEQGQTSAQDRTKFATYFRDETTALDYADQRYYSRTIARFLTPDPCRASSEPPSPLSWNRFAYVLSDPVNSTDPSGLFPTVIPLPPIVVTPPITVTAPPTTAPLIVVPPDNMPGAYTQTINYIGFNPVSHRVPGGSTGNTPSTQATPPTTPEFEKCANSPPMSSSAPNPYDENERYLGISASCMFTIGGDNAWGQLVRGCLVCMRSLGVQPAPAHEFCYFKASQRTTASEVVVGYGVAFAGAIACANKDSQSGWWVPVL